MCCDHFLMRMRLILRIENGFQLVTMFCQGSTEPMPIAKCYYTTMLLKKTIFDINHIECMCLRTFSDESIYFLKNSYRGEVHTNEICRVSLLLRGNIIYFIMNRNYIDVPNKLLVRYVREIMITLPTLILKGVCFYIILFLYI